VGDKQVSVTYLNPPWKNTLQTQINFLVLNIMFFQCYL